MDSERQGLCAQSVCVTAQGGSLLRNIDLQLPPGQVGAILGPNGAGKSTLLGILAGLIAPQHGRVMLDGQPIGPAQMPVLARRRAVLPQETQVAFDFSVREVVKLGRYPHRLQPSQHETKILSAAMTLTDVLHLADRPMAWLSGGERLRVQLARVLAQIWEPVPHDASRWLLLDEPTAALDLYHQHSVLGTVREWAHSQGVGVLMVLHDLNLALRYADQAWVLQQGRLVAHGATLEALNVQTLQTTWCVRSTPVQDIDSCPQILTAVMSTPIAAPNLP